jgi:hypothetical protein
VADHLGVRLAVTLSGILCGAGVLLIRRFPLTAPEAR